MKNPLTTCRDCKFMKIHELDELAVATCSARNGAIVPHKSEKVEGGCELTFFRVPLSCPRKNDTVSKEPEGTNYEMKLSYRYE